MIRRPSDAWPQFLLDEYRRLARLPVDPVTLVPDVDDENAAFACRQNVKTEIFRFCHNGQDLAGLLATVCWLREGPKIVNVTEEQYQALSRVEVRLPVQDFAMPYPTLLVNMPEGKMHRYVILHKRTLDSGLPVVIGCSVSADHSHDIVTVAHERPDYELEEALGKFLGDISTDEGEATNASLRVTCNMALAMTGYGCQASYLFPAEVERDRKFAANRKRPDTAKKAQERLDEQPVLLTLDRTVQLYRREGPRPQAREPTGREMPFHWRRGHWHMVAHGKGRMERKRVLYPPVMVRADLMMVAPEDTTTTYQ